MAFSVSTPDILGERQYGQDVRTQNGTFSHSLTTGFLCCCLDVNVDSLFMCLNIVVACQSVANIVKTSLGPVGLDKVTSLTL